MPKTKDVLFVSIQFFLMLVFFLDVSWFSINFIEYHVWFYFGLLGLLISILAILQMNIHLSPFPTPKPDAKLITSGIFKLSRHPIYTGIIIFMFSFSFWLGDGYKLCISVLTFILFYFKSNYEETMLEKKFAAYKIYKSKTGRFFCKF